MKEYKHIMIFDLDGTIIDSSHRYATIEKNGKKYIDLEHWRKFDKPEFIAKDSLLPLAKLYKESLAKSDTYVIVATARACKVGDANYMFLKEKLGMPDYFIHRGIDDNRKGATIKINGIKPLLNLKPFKNATKTFFEDNIDYLKSVCSAIDAKPVYVPSVQGY